MDVVHIRRQPPPLRRPVLLAAFKGWNDAGEAASGALEVLHTSLGATEFAGIEAEGFFDFQSTRPTVRRTEDGGRTIDWPDNEFSWAAPQGALHDVVLLDGTEPNLRWQAFAGGVAELAVDLGVELVVTLGALQVDVPHTRPVPITGGASDGQLAAQLGLPRSNYEGPTGMTGVLYHASVESGLTAVSLWAGVPHYLAGTPFLSASLALAERVAGLVGADLSLEKLARDAAGQADDIQALLAEDDDLAEYVAELEERFATAHADDNLPDPTMSGDELAAELERYLRDRSD